MHVPVTCATKLLPPPKKTDESFLNKKDHTAKSIKVIHDLVMVDPTTSMMFLFPNTQAKSMGLRESLNTSISTKGAISLLSITTVAPLIKLIATCTLREMCNAVRLR